jgi:tetratricopeptide (TPR) repeat protein
MISCKTENTSPPADFKKFEKVLEDSKKRIDQMPESYFYYVKVALTLELLERHEESKKYYSKAREAFYVKEASYWKTYDSLSMAGMLLEIGDSIRARNLVKEMIQNKSSRIPEERLNELFNKTHAEILATFKEGLLQLKTVLN